MSEPTGIGARIRKLRGNSSIAVFADRFNVHKNTLARYERGENHPDAPFLVQLCAEFKVTPNWLLLGEGDMQPKQPAAPPAAALDRATRSLASPPPGPPQEKFSISEMLTKTASVLESETIFAAALAANIKAFHQAVANEPKEEMRYTHALDHHSRIKELEKRLEDMERENRERDALEGQEADG